jgi:hypothetical protein
VNRTVIDFKNSLNGNLEVRTTESMLESFEGPRATRQNESWLLLFSKSATIAMLANSYIFSKGAS